MLDGAKLRAAFDRDGFVRLARLVATEDANDLLERLWQDEADTHGRVRDDPSSWYLTTKQGLQLRAGSRVLESESCQKLEASLLDAIGQIFGPSMWRPQGTYRGMIRLPAQDRSVRAWNVNHATWHTDEGTQAFQPLPHVLAAWVFVDSVEPRGGGTLMLAGSTQQARRIADASRAHSLSHQELTRVLSRESSWIADLLTKNKGGCSERAHRFLSEGTTCAGIPMRVVENTGDVGDVVFFDPRMLHAEVSRNVSERPRSIIRIDYVRKLLTAGAAADCSPTLQRLLKREQQLDAENRNAQYRCHAAAIAGAMTLVVVYYLGCRRVCVAK